MQNDDQGVIYRRLDNNGTNTTDKQGGPSSNKGTGNKRQKGSSMTVEYTRQATEEEVNYRNSTKGDGDDTGLDAPLIGGDDNGATSGGGPSSVPQSPAARQNSSQSAGGRAKGPRHSDTYYAILRAYCSVLDKLLSPAMALKLATGVSPEVRGRLQLFVRPLIGTTTPSSPLSTGRSSSCLPPFPPTSGLAARFHHDNKSHSQHLRQLWWCMDSMFHTLEGGEVAASSSSPTSPLTTTTSSSATVVKAEGSETPSALLEAVKVPLTTFERNSTTIVIHTGDEAKGDAGSPVLVGGSTVVEEEIHSSPCLDVNGGVAIISERWKRLGFQGCDPATDFRGSGLMALRQLLQLFDSYPQVVERIFTDSETISDNGNDDEIDNGKGGGFVPIRRRCCEYPFAAACVNITMHLLMLLSIEPHRTENGDTAAATCITAETARHSYTTLRASNNLCAMVGGSVSEAKTSRGCGGGEETILRVMEARLGEVFMLSVMVMHEHWCQLPPNSRNLLMFNTEVLKRSRLVMEVILREAESIEEIRDRVRRGGEAGTASPFSGLL